MQEQLAEFQQQLRKEIIVKEQELAESGDAVVKRILLEERVGQLDQELLTIRAELLVSQEALQAAKELISSLSKNLSSYEVQ